MFGAVVCYGDYSAFGVVVGLFPNSEGPQQHGADKKKYGAHRQDIEPHGKVHVGCLLGLWREYNRGAPRSEARNVLRCGRFPEDFVGSR